MKITRRRTLTQFIHERMMTGQVRQVVIRGVSIELKKAGARYTFSIGPAPRPRKENSKDEIGLPLVYPAKRHSSES